MVLLGANKTKNAWNADFWQAQLIATPFTFIPRPEFCPGHFFLCPKTLFYTVFWCLDLIQFDQQPHNALSTAHIIYLDEFCRIFDPPICCGTQNVYKIAYNGQFLHSLFFFWGISSTKNAKSTDVWQAQLLATPFPLIPNLDSLLEWFGTTFHVQKCCFSQFCDV